MFPEYDNTYEGLRCLDIADEQQASQHVLGLFSKVDERVTLFCSWYAPTGG